MARLVKLSEAIQNALVEVLGIPPACENASFGSSLAQRAHIAAQS
jgi:hypothetical protein